MDDAKQTNTNFIIPTTREPPEHGLSPYVVRTARNACSLFILTNRILTDSSRIARKLRPETGTAQVYDDRVVPGGAGSAVAVADETALAVTIVVAGLAAGATAASSLSATTTSSAVRRESKSFHHVKGRSVRISAKPSEACCNVN